MANNEIPRSDQSDQTTREAYQLYQFMDSFRPTFSHDPITLAQEFQQTIDITDDPHFRKIMGSDGEVRLNKIAPNQIAYRHLAILTNRLIVLSEDAEVVGDYTTKTLVTGLFDRFSFEDADQRPYAERDWIVAQLVKPEFLFTQSRKIAIELFDANKDLVGVDSQNKLAIPVDAIEGRIYDPELLFQ